MNSTVISGTVLEDPIEYMSGDNGVRCVKFRIKNMYYPQGGKITATNVRCICYGGLASYVYNELYEGAYVLVTGRLMFNKIVTDKGYLERFYIYCTTVSKLEQEGYT